MTALPESFEPVKPYVVEKPSPLLSWKTIQLLMYREVLDYSVFRTEESRELNTVVTPQTAAGEGTVERVAFLASKQKAVESRELANLLRTASESYDFEPPEEECYLKDHLCLNCPRCILFGGTQVSSHSDYDANIKHRISYATAFSVAPFQEVEQALTFNAVNEDTNETGQALGTRNTVRPATLFASVVTLRAVTWRELVLAIKVILQSRKYGAETRIGGGVRNSIVAMNLGWEEALTPLEFTLEICGTEDEQIPDEEWIEATLAKYGEMGAVPDKQKVLTDEALDEVLQAVRQLEINREFLEAAYNDVEQFREVQQ